MIAFGAVLSIAMAAAPLAASSTTAPSTLDDKAATPAAVGFMEGCMMRLTVAKSAADYAAGSTELGVKLKADQQMSTAPVAIEGADGRACGPALP